MQSLPGLVEGLYLHVPFCARKCDYCAFYSHAADSGLVDRFVRCLIQELRLVAGDLHPRTIFFGGGTPSFLNLRQWGEIFSALEELGLSAPEEFTIECNPATVSLDKARLFREHGVNRISMGVQSFDPGLLQRLGRIHSRAQIFHSYEALRAAGFGNINIDLMFGVPGQTLRQWEETLGQAFSLETEHLSCYEVIYEEGTPFHEALAAGAIGVDEDLNAAMYELLLDRTEAAGFRQYEIANFARDPVAAPAGAGPPRHACRHNLGYWNGTPFYGLGPSASEYVGGVRRTHSADTLSYCLQLEQGGRPAQLIDRLPPLQRAGEIAAFGLRRTSGWVNGEFLAATGFDLLQEWKEEIGQTISEGFGTLRGDRFALTARGLRFADDVGARFLR